MGIHVTGRRSSRLRIAALLLVSALLFGCGPTLKPFTGAGLRKGEGVKMAILPFENLSKTQGAGKSMESYILVELLKNAPVMVLDPGEVNAMLSKERVRLATSIPRETLVALGRGLGVDLFMMGTVHDFDMQIATGAGGSGQIPVVSMSLRILDASTGDIVWAGNASRRGSDRETVFGIGRIHSINNLAEETAAEMARAFSASLRK
ncbi:MAG: hypothetical protein HY896_06755 [Deltaproteobacteria bacterium]|nr:hypothetical protein [Deltaproteobacteria bacterium]